MDISACTSLHLAISVAAEISRRAALTNQRVSLWTTPRAQFETPEQILPANTENVINAKIAFPDFISSRDSQLRNSDHPST